MVGQRGECMQCSRGVTCSFHGNLRSPQTHQVGLQCSSGCVPTTLAECVCHHLQLICGALCTAQEGRRAVGSYRNYHDIMRDLLKGVHTAGTAFSDPDPDA